MLKNAIIWWSILSYFIVLPFGLNGDILCIGEDGHVALERGLESGSFAFTSLDEESLDEHCGDCVDVLLASSGDIARAESSSYSFETSTNIVVAALVPQPLLIERLHRSTMPPEPHIAYPRSELLILKDVVLVI